MDAPISDVAEIEGVNSEPNATEAESYRRYVDEITEKVEQLEERANEVEQFYKNTSKRQSITSKVGLYPRNKEKERHVPSRKQQQDASRQPEAAGTRMEELMCQFGIVIRNVTRDEIASPFMQPVDVRGLGLKDYYKVIEKPMDFSTIQKKMDAKEYKNVREIYSDVRLICKNAMEYNEEKSDIHNRAKNLLDIFTRKWVPFLPKITEEEQRQKEDEAEQQLDMQLAEEAAHAKMARDLSNELLEVDMHLEELREIVVQKCRKTSTREKRDLGVGLTKLSPEDLSKALNIVAQSNAGFEPTAEEVNLDLDAQSESTLWRLKFLVKDALENHEKTVANTGGNDNKDNNKENNKNNNNSRNNNKRKREICDAIAKTATRNNRKRSS